VSGLSIEDAQCRDEPDPLLWVGLEHTVDYDVLAVRVTVSHPGALPQDMDKQPPNLGAVKSS
jgi:hypothetical protein